MKFDTIYKISLIGSIIGGLLSIAAVIGIVWVAWHFISKFW